MALIKDGAVIDDTWIMLADDAELPDAPVIVTLDRWLAERDQLIGSNVPFGVRLGRVNRPPRSRAT